MNKIYSKIESINGSVITVKAEDVSYGELAEIETRFGKSLAEVNAIKGEERNVREIDQSICIKCGTCIKTCPFKAIS